MNILFLLKTYTTGGLEVVTSTLANCFANHGHNVSIVAFEKDDGTILNRINKSVHTDILKGIAYNTVNINLLREILQKDQIQIIINQWGLPFYPLKTARRAARGLNVKFISVYHNTPNMNGRLQSVDNELINTHSSFLRGILYVKRFVFKAVTSYSMKWNYKHSDAYVLLSQSFIPIFKRFTSINNAGHIFIQTNPVTIDSTNYNYAPITKQKEIIFVGRLDFYQKKVNRVIDTWALLEKRFPNWQLTIVGDGPDRNNVEQQVEDLQLQHVRFEGFQKPLEYYKRASMLILTSEFEGFPLVLAEAMSFGVVPAVYNSYAAAGDIVHEGVNGLLIPYCKEGFQATVMAERMAAVMSDETCLKRMALEAIQTSKEYSMDNIYDQWMKLFNSL